MPKVGIAVGPTGPNSQPILDRFRIVKERRNFCNDNDLITTEGPEVEGSRRSQGRDVSPQVLSLF